MRTIGIDLAASPPTTAAAVVVWDGPTAHIEPPRLRCTDEELISLLKGLGPGDRAGIDCPFGWPIPFVEAMSAHASGRPWPGRGTDSTTFRATLRHRRTDLLTHRAMGGRMRPPLSVSFDRLGATASRWAHLADILAAQGREVERTGADGVAEVYPAAARIRWGLGSPRSMSVLLDATRQQLHCRPDVRDLYDASEHAFDALIAALVARAVALGLTPRPEGDDLATAEVEGWIHLPEDDSLPRLF